MNCAFQSERLKNLVNLQTNHQDMEEDGKEVLIKVEPDEDLYTNAEQDMLNCGFITENFIKNVRQDISSLLSPSNPESYIPSIPCDKCSILREANTKKEKQIETIFESLRLVQEENADLKVKLKHFDIQVGEQAQEIDQLKKELALAKKQVVDQASSPSPQAGRQAPPTNRRPSGSSSSSSMSPTNLSLSPLESLQQICSPPLPPPTNSAHPGGHPPVISPPVYDGQHILHGIDGSKKMSGYYCICGIQFPMEPLLYRHLKQAISFGSVRLSQLQASTQNPASYHQWNVIVCSLCQEKFFNWSLFRYHTKKTHSINDLEDFEWKEQNMNKNVCNSYSQQQGYN